MEKIYRRIAMMSQAWEYLLSEFRLSLYRVSSLVGPTRSTKDGNAELAPLAKVRTRAEFEAALTREAGLHQTEMDVSLSRKLSRKRFYVDGFCSACNRKTPMLVDYLFAEKRNGQELVPNWRERVVCPFCGMNNRQRLVAGLIREILNKDDPSCRHVYFMEQVTPIFKWAEREFHNHNIVGSEYLGSAYQGGTVIRGVRHEDATNLNFESYSFDLVVSNDVFEHVPSSMKAFSECLRVLKPGGQMLMTIPFHSETDITVARAVSDGGQIRFLLPAEYHGNPVSTSGSLVFTDFGWDLLEEIRKTGFGDVVAEIYASQYYGHYGGAQLVFRATKSKRL